VKPCLSTWRHTGNMTDHCVVAKRCSKPQALLSTSFTAHAVDEWLWLDHRFVAGKKAVAQSDGKAQMPGHHGDTALMRCFAPSRPRTPYLMLPTPCASEVCIDLQSPHPEALSISQQAPQSARRSAEAEWLDPGPVGDGRPWTSGRALAGNI